jgi:choline kinase
MLKNGVHLIYNQIACIRRCYPNSEIIVVSGFEADNIVHYRNLKVRFVENQIFEETGELEQIRLAMNNMETEKMLYISGDLYFNDHSIEGLVGPESTILIDKKNQIDSSEVGVTVVDNYITIMSYGLDSIWSNIIFFNEKELEILRQIASNRDLNKLYAFEAINKVLDKSGKIKAVSHDKSELLKVTSPKDIKKLGEKNANINF